MSLIPPIPPLPPPPCVPIVAICVPDPPPPPPGVDDEPPVLSSLRVVSRTDSRLVLRWTASDDVELLGFRLYVDGFYRSRRSSLVREASFRLRCGRHNYRVEAVDALLQRSSRSVWVRRRCP